VALRTRVSVCKPQAGVPWHLWGFSWRPRVIFSCSALPGIVCLGAALSGGADRLSGCRSGCPLFVEVRKAPSPFFLDPYPPPRALFHAIGTASHLSSLDDRRHLRPLHPGAPPPAGRHLLPLRPGSRICPSLRPGLSLPQGIAHKQSTFMTPGTGARLPFPARLED